VSLATLAYLLFNQRENKIFVFVLYTIYNI